LCSACSAPPLTPEAPLGSTAPPRELLKEAASCSVLRREVTRLAPAAAGRGGAAGAGAGAGTGAGATGRCPVAARATARAAHSSAARVDPAAVAEGESVGGSGRCCVRCSAAAWSCSQGPEIFGGL
jgi:hypothetical protein